MGKGFNETLWVMTADGPALTNSTTATSLIGTTNPKLTLYPGQIGPDGLGRTFRVKASGRASSAASSQGNITFDLRFGAVIVATSQAIALAASQTNITWDLEWHVTVRAVGAGTTANVMHTGRLLSAAVTGTTILIPASAPAVGTGFDSSASQVFDIFGTFSAASASNSITMHQAMIESLNLI